MKSLFVHAWQSSRLFQAAVIVAVAVVAYRLFELRAPQDPAPGRGSAPPSVTAEAFSGGPQVTVTGPGLDPLTKDGTDTVGRAKEGGVVIIEATASMVKSASGVVKEGSKAVENKITGSQPTAPPAKAP